MMHWDFSMLVQDEYYKDTLTNLKSGRYQKMGFYILPYMPEKFRVRVVYLPKEKNFEEIYRKHKSEIEKLKISFDKEKSIFEEKVEDIFGEIRLEIVISPQLTGSFGSFDIDEKRIVIRPRFDRNIVGLKKLIVRAITVYENPKLKSTLLHNEVEKNVLRFGLGGKSLRQILYKNMAGKYIEESCEYLNELGYEIKGEYVDFDKLKLTKKERLIVDLLQKNCNQLVTNDQIADVVWGEYVEEKYSLYAISKLIDRLRRKIYENSGRNVIHSQRGVGYVMQG